MHFSSRIDLVLIPYISKFLWPNTIRNTTVLNVTESLIVSNSLQMRNEKNSETKFNLMSFLFTLVEMLLIYGLCYFCDLQKQTHQWLCANGHTLKIKQGHWNSKRFIPERNQFTMRVSSLLVDSIVISRDSRAYWRRVFTVFIESCFLDCNWIRFPLIQANLLWISISYIQFPSVVFYYRIYPEKLPWHNVYLSIGTNNSVELRASMATFVVCKAMGCMRTNRTVTFAEEY